MITALLLPLLALTGPNNAAVRSPGAVDPPIQIWISNDRRFLPGDRATVQVRTREDGYLLVLQVDPGGNLRVLFPLDPNDDNFARGGQKYDVRGRGGRESFTVDNTRGQGTIYAAVSHDAFKFDQFMLGDHWDYRNLAPQHLSADPEQELNELVRKMVDNSFDYDILSYDVLERVVYASDYSSESYGGGGYYGCGYYCGGGLYFGSPYSLSLGLFFGAPYYGFYSPYYPIYSPYYYPYPTPYYYSPTYFYRPYYYRPYYYRPYYYRPFYYPTYPYYPGYYPPYAGHYHGYAYGNGFYGGGNQPYSPYRFRPADGIAGTSGFGQSGFRRAVNTVYTPPAVRSREAANASVGRRVVDPQPAGDARRSVDTRRSPAGEAARSPSVDARRSASNDAGAARRAVDRGPTRTPESTGGRRVENRMAQPNIDARRARQPEEVRSIMSDSRELAGGRGMPTEVRGTGSDVSARRAMDRPEQLAGRVTRSPSEIEARPARGYDGGSMDRGRSDAGFGRRDNAADIQDSRSGEMSGVYRPEPRSADRGGDQGSYRGGDRGSYSPSGGTAPPAPNGGGMRGSGGGGGGGGGDGWSRGGGGGGGGGGFRRR